SISLCLCLLIYLFAYGSASIAASYQQQAAAAEQNQITHDHYMERNWLPNPDWKKDQAKYENKAQKLLNATNWFEGIAAFLFTIATIFFLLGAYKAISAIQPT